MCLCKCKLPRHLSVSQILFLSCPSVSQLIVFPPPITTTTPKAADVGTAEWAITRFVLHGGRRRREGRTHCEGGKGLAPKPWFFPGGAQRELIFRDEIFEVGEKLVGLFPRFADAISHFIFLQAPGHPELQCWHWCSCMGRVGGGGAVLADCFIHKAIHCAINQRVGEAARPKSLSDGSNR